MTPPPLLLWWFLADRMRHRIAQISSHVNQLSSSPVSPRPSKATRGLETGNAEPTIQPFLGFWPLSLQIAVTPVHITAWWVDKDFFSPFEQINKTREPLLLYTSILRSLSRAGIRCSAWFPVRRTVLPHFLELALSARQDERAAFSRMMQTETLALCSVSISTTLQKITRPWSRLARK